MAVSATITAYVQRFIHSSTNMTPATRLIRRPIDRPNIYLEAIGLKHSTKSFKDRDFVLDGNPQHPVEIPQTIVFMDNRREACTAWTTLWSQTPPDWLQKHPMALADVSTGLGDPRRRFVMKAFKQGVCRVLFATDVAGMGIDFPSVRRVIQWRVTPTLTISALWQRFGRCVRDPTQQGVARFLYSARCVIPGSGEPLSVLCEPGRGEDVAPILRLIEDDATGKPDCTARQHDPLDLEAPDSVSAFHPDETALDDASAGEGSTALAEDGMDLYDDLDLDKFDLEDFDLDDLTIDSQEGPLSDESEGDDGSEYDAAAEENDRTVRKTSKRERKFRPPGTCRGVLWFINTPRCRRDTILQVFDEPDFDHRNFDIPSPAVASEPRDPPCCDRHVPRHRLP
jgi:superfamily II DNA/RNA helicase